MQRIKSFEINHDVLVPGFYISREDGDVITYDLRTRRPNMGDYMSDAVMHSVEHMFATFARNSEYADSVIYFGPMGCQTGFYFLLRNTLTPQQAFELTKDILRKTIAHEGDVFGKSAKECGHFENLDLSLAKEECKTYLAALEAQKDMTFAYPTR